MAQPIKLTIPARDPKQELMARLEQAPAEHAAALLDGYELLQELHENGVFQVIRGLLGAKEKIVDDLAVGATLPESIRAMRNGIILAKMLGSVDPELLLGISKAVAQTVGDRKEVATKPPGRLSLLFSATGADERRGLDLMRQLLGRIGARINTHTSDTIGRRRD